MKKANNPNSKQQPTTPAAKPKTAASTTASTGMDNAKLRKILWYSALGVFIFVALLLFDAKLFLMGDDADYILDAHLFVKQNIYPAGRSSLYGMVLGIPVALFGTNVLALKCFSLLCAITYFILFYRSFRNRIPDWMLYTVLFFIGISAEIQYYSSSNLSEAFFMMIQGFFFVTVFNVIERQERDEPVTWKSWLLVGLCSLLLSLSKNVAVIAPVSLTVFYLLRGKLKPAGWALLAFAIFKFPYEFLLKAIYKSNTVVGQMSQVLAKDLYHPEKGQETIGGFFDRLIQNAQIYLYNDTMFVLGFKSEEPQAAPFLFWILFLGLFIYTLLVSYRKNLYIFFTGVYLSMMCSITFFALQPAVAQRRIIIIFIPLIVCFLLYGIHSLMQRFLANSKMGRNIVIALICFIIFAVNLQRTYEKAETTYPVLTENLYGDPLYGYTPDWMNYLAMGKWIKENIPDSAVVAARKPNSLSVYSNGRPFFGIYRVNYDLDADALLADLKKNNVHYLVLASLRADPRYPAGEGNMINTLHVYAVKIMQKYPQMVKEVKRIGDAEPCYLMRIDW